jgi:hypothetical protein
MTDDEKQLFKVTAEATLKPFGNLLERLFGGAVDQIGGEWEDRVKVRRALRREKLYAKLKTRLDDAGIDPQGIPEKIWVPALQSASLEDDESLQEKWASLLANASDPRGTTLVLPTFPTILKELTSLDARFLNAFYEHAYLNPPQNLVSMPAGPLYTDNDLLELYPSDALGVVSYDGSMIRFRVTVDTLERSGLLSRTYMAPNADEPPSHGLTPIIHGYQITTLGQLFVAACRPPHKNTSISQ